jgi:hypothetical protein
MKLNIIFLILISVFSLSDSIGQYTDPNYPAPLSGYGSEGPFRSEKITFTNPSFPSRNIEIYYPEEITGSVPTIFYCHGFGGNNPENIQHMLNFTAGNGFAIVFVPYQTVGVTVQERYDNLTEGFRLAARKFSDIIDTTRTGFMGHSFGGGAVFHCAYKCFTENNWGQKGRFIYSLAPWYSYITQAQLTDFPPDTKVLIEIFENDTVNDHRMAADLFRNINVSDEEKDFIMVRSDTIGNYIYAADHGLPNSKTFNILDYNAYFRFIHALSDYTFNDNLAGKIIALGNGNNAQTIVAEGLKEIIQTDNPHPMLSEEIFDNPCSDVENFRKQFCSGPLTGVEAINTDENSLVKAFSGVPESFFIIQDEQVSIVNTSGKIVSEIKGNDVGISQQISILPPGIYILRTIKGSYRFIIL